MKSKKAILLVALLGIFLLMSCLGSGFLIYKYFEGNGEDKPLWIPKLSDSMESFSSDEEFDNYIAEVEKDMDNGSGTNFGFGDMGILQESSDMEASPKTPGDDGITNVQETGVDEGDIVKAYKGYLVILRRGKLFTVSLDSNSRSELEAVSLINAYPEGFTQGTWYDEMLIYKNKIIVIGYTYQLSATDINIFEINDSGVLTHLDSYYIDSNDYYSSRNYASRLVDNQLIFYMPFYLYDWTYDGDEYRRELSLPQIREWIEGDNLSEGRDILNKTDIYKPVQDSYSPTLHTVVKCNLDNEDFDCNARAILGPYSRTFYVSPNAIYIWVSESDYSYLLEEEDTEDRDDYTLANSYVYMFLLDDSTARVLKADGSPIDQFSFKEDSDGYLNVLVREYSAGDAMWNPEATSGTMALLRVSLEAFSSEAKEVGKDSYKDLLVPEGYTIQNRFVGDYLLYGSGSNWYYDESAENSLYITAYINDNDVQKVNLNHSVDRLEVLGDDAVVVGTDNEDLLFSSVELTNDPKVLDKFTVDNAKQGELRSHGFFYKEYYDYGVLCLPIIGEGESYEHLFKDSAQIIYLKVDASRNFTSLGTLDGTPPEDEYADDCEYSCVDWYGNSRPIFYKDRVFGLLGYELVEGKIVKEKIDEIARLNYLNN